MINGINYGIKKALAADVEEHLLACNHQFIPPLSEKVDINAYANKIYDRAITFEAWNENKLIGLIAIYFNNPEQFGFITNVSVDPKWTGKGLAAALLKNCLEYAVNQKFNTVSLEVNENNKKAIGLYAKFGFEKESQKDDSLIMKWKNKQNTE